MKVFCCLITCSSPFPHIWLTSKTFPVQLRAGLPHPGPLLPHLIPPPPHCHRRGWGCSLLCIRQKWDQENCHRRYFIIKLAQNEGMVDRFCKYQYLPPGHEVTLAQQYAGIAAVSIPFFLLAGAGGIVFWVGTPSICHQWWHHIWFSPIRHTLRITHPIQQYHL